MARYDCTKHLKKGLKFIVLGSLLAFGVYELQNFLIVPPAPFGSSSIETPSIIPSALILLGSIFGGWPHIWKYMRCEGGENVD